MYDISDKRNAVKEIQRYLFQISDNHIPLSGIYDENTRNEVLLFQKNKGINQSGVVDRATFELLYEDYIAMEDSDYDMKFPLLPGSYGENIRDINKKIAAILDFYGIFHRMHSSPYYSKETELCIEKIRQIYNLKNFSGIDKELYSRIISDCKNISPKNGY